MWSRSKQHQLFFGFVGQILQQAIALLLILVGTGRLGASMCFVDDNEVRAMIKEDVALVVLLHIVDGDNLERNVTENILVRTQFLLQTTDSRRTDNLCFQSKLILDFILPLLTKMWQAYYRKTVNLVAIKQFLGYQQRLQCLADTNVVRDEQSDSFLLECKNQWNHLIWTWLKRKFA